MDMFGLDQRMGMPDMPQQLSWLQLRTNSGGLLVKGEFKGSEMFTNKVLDILRKVHT